MIRTSLGLILLFAVIAAACVAFGAYFSLVTLQTAHRKAIETRFGVTAERIVASAQTAAGLGIALPAQITLADLTRREARLDEAILSIDIIDTHDKVLFSSDPARITDSDGSRPANAVTRRIENDLAAAIGRVVVRYKPAVLLAEGESALEGELQTMAMPTLIGSALATILIAFFLRPGSAGRRSAPPIPRNGPARRALPWPRPRRRMRACAGESAHDRIAGRHLSRHRRHLVRGSRGHWLCGPRLVERTIVPAIAAQAESVGRSAASLVESAVLAGVPMDRLVGVDSYLESLRSANRELAELKLVDTTGRSLGSAGAPPADDHATQVVHIGDRTQTARRSRASSSPSIPASYPTR